MSAKDYLSPFGALAQLLRQPHTLKYPYEKKPFSERYRGFHANDLERCVGCGNCARVCMNQAITMVEWPEAPERPGSTKLRPQIDYGRCCWCGLCVDVCPTGSLSLTDRAIRVYTNREERFWFPTGEHFTGRGWRSDERTTLLPTKRHEPRFAPPEERARSFARVVLGFEEAEARAEAARCLGCALCVQGCPTQMHIPDYLAQIASGDYEGALRTFFKTNPLPEICGIVCTHRCEDACVYSHRFEPIQIRFEKGFAASRFSDYSEVLTELKPGPATGFKVAIVGSGPSGLAAAFYLRLKGHEVHIFEREKFVGGMLRMGLPPYREPRDVVDKEINFILSTGPQVHLGVEVGKDVSLQELLEEFDAVYLATGFIKGRKMGIPGEDAEGVSDALDYLKAVNLAYMENPSEDYVRSKVFTGKTVVVVGGGNTAMDACRTPLRLGAERVVVMYRRRRQDMPATPEEVEEALEEGVELWPQTLPVEIIKDERGRVRAVKFVRTRMVDQGPGRRPKPVPIEGSEEVLEADQVLMAIGQAPDLSYLPEELKERLEIKWNKIPTDANGMTKIPGLFAGGDLANTRMDIVSAVADGRRAAAGIDRWLRAKK